MHTVRSLAELVGGKVAGEGADKIIDGINDLRSAEPNQISFLGNTKYEPLARSSRAGVILVRPQDSAKFTFTRIEVDSPSAAFGMISALFAPPPVRDEPGVHPTAIIGADVVLGEGVSIQPHAVIGAGARIGARTFVGANSFIGEQTVIGDDCRIYPLVVIRERCVLGARVILHSGVVIGGDGFGYEFQNGRHVKIPHTGIVQIDNDVEIGANTTVDRARFGKTHIGEGVKIDNLVMIAHNVNVGAHSIIVSQTGISGSTSLGRYVTLAGQVGLAGHLNIGDKATITAKSGLNKDVPAGAIVSGLHALPMREFLKLEALGRRLPEFFERLKALEDKKGSVSEIAPMAESQKVKIGLLQTWADADPVSNLKRTLQLAHAAADQGAQIISTQELFRSQYFCQSEDHANFALGEEIPNGPSTQAFCELARARGVVVVASLFERRAAGLYHNTAVVIDADGSYLGKYRKMHIPDDPLFHEKFYFTPGDLGFRAWNTRFGRIGVLVCWDQWFPEAARLTALDGAQVIFYPTAIGWHPSEREKYGEAHHSSWETIQRSHAIANGCYVAVTNRIGLERPIGGDGIQFWGQSFIANPSGQILTKAGEDREEIIVQEIDLATVEVTRTHWPFLRDRRIDAYRDLSRRLVD